MRQFASSRSGAMVDAYLPCRYKKEAYRREVSHRVAQLKNQADCLTFPTDLPRLARSVGIVEVRAVSLAFDGRLLRESRGFVVEVNTVLGDKDRRFVAAHEITHLLLEGDRVNADPLGRAGSPDKGRLAYRIMEELCDWGAAEILLPVNSVREELRGGRPSPDVLFRIAAEADCTIRLAAERIVAARVWQVGFVCWRVQGGSAAAQWMVSATEKSHDVRWILLPDYQNSLVRRALLQNETVSGRESLSFCNEIELFRAHCRRIDDSTVLTMIVYGGL